MTFQISANVSPLLERISCRSTVEVLAVDLVGQVVKTIAAYIDVSMDINFSVLRNFKLQKFLDF